MGFAKIYLNPIYWRNGVIICNATSWWNGDNYMITRGIMLNFTGHPWWRWWWAKELEEIWETSKESNFKFENWEKGKQGSFGKLVEGQGNVEKFMSKQISKVSPVSVLFIMLWTWSTFYGKLWHEHNIHYYDY